MICHNLRERNKFFEGLASKGKVYFQIYCICNLSSCVLLLTCAIISYELFLNVFSLHYQALNTHTMIIIKFVNEYHVTGIHFFIYFLKIVPQLDVLTPLSWIYLVQILGGVSCLKYLKFCPSEYWASTLKQQLTFLIVTAIDNLCLSEAI